LPKPLEQSAEDLLAHADAIAGPLGKNFPVQVSGILS
jgi:hypothetical protein